MEGLEEDLKYRRLKLIAEYQDYMATVDSGKQNQLPSSDQIGQLSGRSVKQIESKDSKIKFPSNLNAL